MSLKKNIDKVKNKIKIFYLIETTGPGGAETVLLQLASNLSYPFEPLVGITGKGWVANQLKKKGIPFVILNTGGSYDLKLLRSIINIVRKYNVHIIHAHLFSIGFYAALAGSLLKIPVIVTLHGVVDVDSSPNNIDFKAKFKIFILNKLAKKIVVVSYFLKSYYEKLGFKKHKLQVIYNGINLNKFYPKPDKSYKYKLGFSNNDILIGAIGNIRKSKGYHYYIQAAALIVKHIPQAKFLLVGEGEDKIEKELHQLVKKLNLNNNFFFLGYRNDIPQILSALDVFVLPSVSEGFSISTIEAMAMKVPVIATKSGGPEEIIENGKSGILIAPGSVRFLAKAIFFVLKNPNQIANFINYAYQTVEMRFSLKHQLYSYENLYKSLLN